MTPLNKLEIRRSEIDHRLSELAASEGELPEEAGNEIRTLGKERADLELRIQAALLADQNSQPADTQPDKELVEVRQEAKLTNFLAAAAKGVDVGGAEAELRDACGLGVGANGVLMPFEMLETREVNTQSGNEGGIVQLPIIERVFRTPASQSLGVMPRGVPYGQSQAVVLTSGASGVQAVEGSEAGNSQATFQATTLTPLRLTANYEITHEVMRQVGPEIEQTLRADLVMALSDKMEEQILVGNGTAPNVQGIRTSISQPDIPANVVSFTDAAALPTDLVEGVFANMGSDVSVVANLEAYRRAYRLRDANGGAVSAGDLLANTASSWMASAHLPAAPTSGNRLNVAEGLARLGMREGDCFMPVWEGLELIRDMYSQATSGIVTITAITLWNFRVLRREGFARWAWKLA